MPAADRYLRTDTNTLQWCDDTNFNIDVAEFEAAIAQAKAANNANTLGSRGEARRTLERAASLYRGELLLSCHDDWIIQSRERLQQAFVDVLKQLVVLLERQREIAGAIPYAQRLVVIDPLDEDHAAGLMRLHATHGDRAGAIRAFQAYAAMLQAELGIEPSQALRDAYERLMRADSKPEAASKRAVVDVPSPLIGRQPEWDRLQAAWRQAMRGQAYMLLVSGEAGIGKSRLAEELMIWASQQGIGLAA